MYLENKQSRTVMIGITVWFCPHIWILLLDDFNKQPTCSLLYSDIYPATPNAFVFHKLPSDRKS